MEGLRANKPPFSDLFSLSFVFFFLSASFHLLSLLIFSLRLQKMSQEFEIKRLSLEEQRDRLQQQLDNLKEELSAKLNMANQEVQNIQSAPLTVLKCIWLWWWWWWGWGGDNPLLISSGVPPPGAGEGGGAEPELGSDADHLSEGNSGEAEDRTGCDQISCPRDQQPADGPSGEEEPQKCVRLLSAGPSCLLHNMWGTPGNLNVLHPRKCSFQDHYSFIIGNFILFKASMIRSLTRSLVCRELSHFCTLSRKII